MKRLLVNDRLSVLDHKTLWHYLKEWFLMDFVGGDYATLAKMADAASAHEYLMEGALTGERAQPTLIIRNGTYFPPLKASERVPTISLIQDIIADGPVREMQEKVMLSSSVVVFNSVFTHNLYVGKHDDGLALRLNMGKIAIIPLPVDFSVFEPGNAMGLQQLLSLPDGCICWIGACREAGHIKGWDTFIRITRTNPDLHFVAVLKDAMPDSVPPNVRCYVKVPHEELVRIIGACRVGLCTSRMESQHLAGIEMGACGLPMVAPPVGVYYERNDLPGILYDKDADAAKISEAVRLVLSGPGDKNPIRAYWREEHDVPVIKEKWTKLVEEVETNE